MTCTWNHVDAVRQARNSYLASEDPTLQEVELVPDEFDLIHHHEALAFDHYIQSYQLFLQGADLFPEQERALQERYGRCSVHCA